MTRPELSSEKSCASNRAVDSLGTHHHGHLQRQAGQQPGGPAQHVADLQPRRGQAVGDAPPLGLGHFGRAPNDRVQVEAEGFRRGTRPAEVWGWAR